MALVRVVRRSAAASAPTTAATPAAASAAPNWLELPPSTSLTRKTSIALTDSSAMMKGSTAHTILASKGCSPSARTPSTGTRVRSSPRGAVGTVPSSRTGSMVPTSTRGTKVRALSTKGARSPACWARTPPRAAPSGAARASRAWWRETSAPTCSSPTTRGSATTQAELPSAKPVCRTITETPVDTRSVRHTRATDASSWRAPAATTTGRGSIRSARAPATPTRSTTGSTKSTSRTASPEDPAPASWTRSRRAIFAAPSPTTDTARPARSNRARGVATTALNS